MATPSSAFLQRPVHPTFGFPLPPFDHVTTTYVASGAGDDDDVATRVFRIGGASGTVVATLTYTYVGSTNNQATAVLTVP